MQSGINVWDLDEHRAALLRNAKILWVSSDVAFNSRFENVYSLCNKYGFKIIGNLNYETLSYNNAFTLDDWARVVNQAKNTYPLIAVWEIWNEPTLTKYHLGYMDGSPQHYVDLLKIAYEILKAANPNYVVLGLGGSQLNCVLDLPFSESVFSLGGGAYMDAISIHAYPDDLNKGQTWDYYKTVWTKLLDQYNKFGKDLWLTETGLESNQLTEEDQANYLKNSYSFFEEQGIAAFVFFQLIDYWETDTQVAFWGLLRTDQTVKPSYVAYEDLLETR